MQDVRVRRVDHRRLRRTRDHLSGMGHEPLIELVLASDERLLQTQYLVYDDDAALLQTSKDALADLDRLFAADLENESREAAN